jgi:hypothetical protein
VRAFLFQELSDRRHRPLISDAGEPSRDGST